MKKTFILLLVCAVAVWGYVAAQVTLALWGKTGSTGATSTLRASPAATLLAKVHPPLDTSYRDPYQSYLYAKKPAPVATPRAATVAAAPAPKAIEPPKAVLNGILWGESPVAILKQDGKTELVGVGAEVWDFEVFKIEPNQVIVIKQGRKFTLGY